MFFYRTAKLNRLSMHSTKTLLAAIVDFDIYLNSDHAFIASIKLLHLDQILTLGGEEIFSGECCNDSRYFLHFLKRCMAVNQVEKIQDLLGLAVKVQVVNEEIIGISSLAAQDWFFPITEFNALKQITKLR